MTICLRAEEHKRVGESRAKFDVCGRADVQLQLAGWRSAAVHDGTWTDTCRVVHTVHSRCSAGTRRRRRTPSDDVTPSDGIADSRLQRRSCWWSRPHSELLKHVFIHCRCLTMSADVLLLGNVVPAVDKSMSV